MCLFCDIVAGKIPAYKVYEDDKILAFLDISQVTKGHTLVISKQHFSTILDVDKDTLAHLMCKAQDITKHLASTFNCKGFNILSNVHEVAGQSVFHFHLHIIPRYSENDAFKLSFEESDKQDLEQLVNQLKED